MSPRTGRPTTDPRGTNRTGVRLTDSDMGKLEFCMAKTGMSKTDIIRRGIDAAYRNENLIEEESIAMSKKYNGSFEVDCDEIPKKCPICGTEFDLREDVDLSPYKDGFRSVLMCPKCNFRKVLSYTTEQDAERQMREDMEYD